MPVVCQLEGCLGPAVENSARPGEPARSLATGGKAAGKEAGGGATGGSGLTEVLHHIAVTTTGDGSNVRVSAVVGDEAPRQSIGPEKSLLPSLVRLSA